MLAAATAVGSLMAMILWTRIISLRRLGARRKRLTRLGPRGPGIQHRIPRLHLSRLKMMMGRRKRVIRSKSRGMAMMVMVRMKKRMRMRRVKVKKVVVVL
jgi:hypothetical protein